MSGFPINIQEVGRLIDLGVIDLTGGAIPVSVRSRVVMGVSVQAESNNSVDVLVGDKTRQSRRLAARDVYLIQVGDANNVWIRAPLDETAQVNVHLIVPPGVR